jgi:hypothetical protein
MKLCTKCKIEKSLDLFGKHTSSKDGLYYICKECNNLNTKNWLKKNKDYSKKYYLKNNQKIIERSKKWNFENKEKIKDYLIDNKNRIKLTANEYQKNRKLNDKIFRLRGNISSLISISIKKQGYSKKSKTFNILGCSIEDFKLHIEKQFKDNMSWENYGQWHFDHIYPISLAKSEEEVIKLNHYTNFQPLWAIDNIKKSNKII